jgi:hypothetical protein
VKISHKDTKHPECKKFPEFALPEYLRFFEALSTEAADAVARFVAAYLPTCGKKEDSN